MMRAYKIDQTMAKEKRDIFLNVIITIKRIEKLLSFTFECEE